MDKTVHLIKLSVGTENPEDLAAWQALPQAQTADGLPCHVTRMWPKREAEVLNGGSIFWVIKGQVQCRQKIIRLDEVMGADGIRRCAIVLAPDLIRTTIAPRRPFQGWRYLNVEDAPKDMTASRLNDDPLPAELAGALADIGVL
ncbi:DUF1489 family protein [Pseudoprimorskyibacter insulae]|uniref:DUF1489 family protein n=1 Tax=Pseudoprimorskyibacter insulae TaxID=1695997 RepID=UPI000D5606B2|nr:DUF1489 domain-containing protein [Pseudoprimorskyibacter insulae]